MQVITAETGEVFSSPETQLPDEQYLIDDEHDELVHGADQAQDVPVQQGEQ
jgi:hypothetical protein